MFAESSTYNGTVKKRSAYDVLLEKDPDEELAKKINEIRKCLKEIDKILEMICGRLTS